MSSKEVARLAEATGLAREAAEKCLGDHHGDYRTALASVVQSLATLPPEVFEFKDRLDRNAKTINNELRETYAKVQEVMKTAQSTEPAAWSALQRSGWEVNKAIQACKDESPSPAQQQGAEKGPPAATTHNLAATPTTTLAATAAVSTLSAAPTAPAASLPAPPAFSFGFGQAPITSGAATFPQGFGGAGPATSTAPPPLQNASPERPAQKSQTANVVLKKIDDPKHFTGPFLEMPHFWREEVEARCTLLNMDRGFLFKNKDNLRERLLKWVEVTGSFHRDVPVQYYEIVDEDEETTRVIIKDVVRTFFYEEHRSKLTNFLFSAFQELKSYGQPMSFLAAICLLALNEQETMAVLRKVSKEYIPGHWASEAVGFATSAWLVERIMRGRFPDVAIHFDSLNFWPDTYMQKILSGLTVHVLPFDLMFQFLDSFMAEGFVFLIKFELAIIEHFKSELLNIKDPKQMNELYEIMRLDPKAVEPSEARKILQAAQKMDSQAPDLKDLDMYRMKVYDEKVFPRLQRAPKEEAFEPCGICEKEKPRHWCDDCGLAICDHCHQGSKGAHVASHPVEKY